MKFFNSFILMLFVFSFIGLALAPSSIMALCDRVGFCDSMTVIHYIEKLSNFFNNVLLSIVIISLFVASFAVKFSRFLKNNKICFYIKQCVLFTLYNNIFFNYLKMAFSDGLIRSKVYIV